VLRVRDNPAAARVVRHAIHRANMKYTANPNTPLAVLVPFPSMQRVLGPVPDRWLDLLGLSGEAAVPQWLFTNWTLMRQHTSKQVPCNA
jgi:hypothetical protein